MSDELRISVVIQCFDQARFLPDSIGSVLAQTTPAHEVIVVDDGSHDDTGRVAGQYAQVRYIRQENRGLPAARNTGVAASSGDALVFLDADDRLLPTALAVGAEALSAHPRCAFVCGHFRYIDVAGIPVTTVTEPCPPEPGYAALLRNNFIRMHATVMYRRTALTRAGGFDPACAVCDDYDLFLRIARTEPIACHHQVTAEYRLHDANMSGDAARVLSAALALLRRERGRIVGSPDLRAAYAEGVRFWRECYGRKLLDDVWLHEPAGDLTGRLRALARLARFYPRGLVEYAVVEAGGFARRRLKRRT